MIESWYITPERNIKLDLEASSLDAVTRQLPEGYYSTFRTFGECTRVLGLRAHLRRLYDPVAAPRVSAIVLRRQLRLLLKPYPPHEARLRAIMTKAGEAYLAIEPLKPLPKELYERGVRVESTELQRDQPRLKSTAFIGSSASEREHIAREGIFEALLVRNGKILEGMTSNFFFVQQREGGEAVLCTAGRGVLPGVTRGTVIGLARGRGLEVKYEALGRDQLAAAREAFITSSSRGIVPVVEIDNLPVGEGRPGPATKALMDAYEQHVLRKAERI